jgi:hypothetical protein
MTYANLQTATTPNDAVNDLLEMGVARVRLSDDIIKASEEVLVEAYDFFSNPDTIKEKFSTPNALEGWRGIGAELSPDTGRPDLVEAFAVWFHNVGRSNIIDWADHCLLHRSMTKALSPYAVFIEDLLNALKCRLDSTYESSHGNAVGIRELSYLQTNFSRPAKHNRCSIMDMHEDGHLLTLLRPSSTGLMIAKGELVQLPTLSRPAGIFQPGGEFQEVVLQDNEGLVIPSSPTFYLTGGLIPPLFHYVANHGQVVRQSVVFFVNPSPAESLTPWYQNPLIEDVKIHDVVNYMSSQYGQLSISQVFKN